MKKLFLPIVVLMAGVSYPVIVNAQAEPVADAAAPSVAQPSVPSSPVAGGIVPQPTDDGIVSVMPTPEAQNEVAQEKESTSSKIEKEINDRLAYLNPGINVNQMTSLFLTPWEHDLIASARQGLTTSLATGDPTKAVGVRDITLSGIVYASAKEWTLWLNGMRVTPKSLPGEIMNVNVHKDYVELEWFDAPTNQIFPLRLRAHQRFNLDTRIFLPE